MKKKKDLKSLIHHLQRRCAKDCIFAPYFPPDDPHKFAIVHKVFGASNVSKMLQELPVHQRADAVSSLVYEANARMRDPVYGCVGAISYLQNQVSQLQMQLAVAQAEILCIQMQQQPEMPATNPDPSMVMDCDAKAALLLSGSSINTGSSKKRVSLDIHKLGDELEFHVINDPQDSDDEVSDELESKGDAKNTTVKEIESLKVFQGKKSSPLAIPLKAGKQPMVMDSSRAKWKTAPKLLPQEVIEGQFGNTMKDAAEKLDVSLSTLKRKCKEYHIYEWQGPNVVKKKKVNASSNNQSNINEEDNGTIQEPSIVNRNENTLTIKAEYVDDMIKFDLRTSQASLVNIEKEIGKKLNLKPGTFKLKYLDKDEDLILLTSDEDMRDCIKYFRNLGLHVVRLRVLSSPQKPSS